MISAEMIAPLLEQLTAGAELADAQAGAAEYEGFPSVVAFHDGRTSAFTDAVVLVSAWAAGVQS
jgi:hypothetical protein